MNGYCAEDVVDTNMHVYVCRGVGGATADEDDRAEECMFHRWVCLCVYVFARSSLCLRTCRYTCMCKCIYAYMYTYVLPDVSVAGEYVYATCISLRLHVRAYTYPCICRCACVYVCV